VNQNITTFLALITAAEDALKLRPRRLEPARPEHCPGALVFSRIAVWPHDAGLPPPHPDSAAYLTRVVCRLIPGSCLK
jgi:hypothetical protein